MFAVFSVAVTILYVLLISRFIRGWDNTPDFQADKMPSQIPVTIITAFKNEENNLKNLAAALDKQTYQNFEWILVNDHSTDKSAATINSLTAGGFPGIILLENEGSGKKKAVKTGIYAAKNELIITLDADVLPSEGWLLNIVSYLERYSADLLICPVKIGNSTDYFSKFQQFEFAALVASGAGAAKSGMPILCNGANLAFKKSIWLENENKLRFDDFSGDDIYLLQALKRKNGVIRFLKSTKAIVQTAAAPSLKQFLFQRKRWAGKKSIYRDKDLLITALIIFLTSVAIIGTAVLSLFEKYYPSLLLLVFIAKFAVDTVLFLKIKRFFGLKSVLINSLIFSVIYPFYIVAAGVLSFLPSKKW